MLPRDCPVRAPPGKGYWTGGTGCSSRAIESRAWACWLLMNESLHPEITESDWEQSVGLLVTGDGWDGNKWETIKGWSVCSRVRRCWWMWHAYQLERSYEFHRAFILYDGTLFVKGHVVHIVCYETCRPHDSIKFCHLFILCSGRYTALYHLPW